MVPATTIGKQVPATTSHGYCDTTIGKQVPATTSHGYCHNNRETSPCDHISWFLQQQ
ncbi:hypothetical protein DPMN_157192 [Dreissena polymorpha]|uniref:Uncharacterized protein n=1 Tax=Dreissena polymorpha TaxID=45954 RepID=A0A9D4IM16_DREPO|nr:hypothetical protein DPMN_157192 [Dreissena polymorpha]